MKSPLNVLVVDDEPLIRWSVCEVLADCGHAVCEAGDGASVVERLSGGTRLSDVIVLDYRLPDSNDLHLIEVVRGLAPDSTVIMTTAFGMPETLAGALRLGVYRVVLKPFDVHDLVRLVADAPLSARGVSVG